MWGGVLAMAALAGFLFWLLHGREASPGENDDQDLSYEEQEAADELRRAEEDVRDLESGARPDDEQPGDDWGPGTARTY
jgi:hypothetical protein